MDKEQFLKIATRRAVLEVWARGKKLRDVLKKPEERQLFLAAFKTGKNLKIENKDKPLSATKVLLRVCGNTAGMFNISAPANMYRHPRTRMVITEEEKNNLIVIAYNLVTFIKTRADFSGKVEYVQTIYSQLRTFWGFRHFVDFVIYLDKERIEDLIDESRKIMDKGFSFEATMLNNYHRYICSVISEYFDENNIEDRYVESIGFIIKPDGRDIKGKDIEV